MIRKSILENIILPEGINAELKGDILKLSKDTNSIEKKLYYPIKVQGNVIKIECEKSTKNQKKLIKSAAAHIRNMIAGLGKKYVYKLQICSVHFPMTVAVKGSEVSVKNFLGEVKDRKAKILPGVVVKIEKEIVTVESCDKEKAGQTAANIETMTRICNRDRRVFQDGIYITEKHKGVSKNA